VLVGADGDAHAYEPTPADARAIGNAGLVIVNGLGYEHWIGQLVVSSGYSGRIVQAANGLEPLLVPGTLQQDPHAWQDVRNSTQYVTNIRDALAEADSEHAEFYRTNAKTYLQRLEALDGWVRSEIARVPETKRKVISSHASFQYFASAYGIRFISPQGLSSQNAAAAGYLARIVDQIKNEKIDAMFMENISDSRLISQLEGETGVFVGGTLYSDALSAPGGPADSYENLIRHNVQELVQGMLHNQ